MFALVVLTLMVILPPGIAAQHNGGKNRIQPTTVAGNTTALPEAKLEKVSANVPLHLHAHLLLYARLYLPVQLFLPAQHTTGRSTTWNIERIVVPSTGTLVMENALLRP
ncbi:hypothetical protein RvY_07134 [Ramazzottius varieornatus]|uniref:Secreted protein n=1 Tax=Ramazzottius varieornatus TaxID=947166 RepID=A0A1D1V9M1_RAMVA|nr:hypothetical protein RvY_07134 [Ramazzottius varieornatus]